MSSLFTRSAPTTARTLVHKLAVGVTAATLALTGAVVITTGSSAPAFAAQSPQCPPAGDGTWPGMSNLPLFTDDNLSVYVGGDARFHNAESEGFIAVTGDAAVARQPSGLYNFGWVGVGSQILPSHTSPMLSVGGDLDLSSPSTTVVMIGRDPAPTGTYMVGGAIASPAKVTVGTAAPYNLGGTFADGFGARVTSESASYAAATPTGGHAWAGGAWDPMIFTGDSTSSTQIFSVSGADLAQISIVDFRQIPVGASVVINVTGPTVSISHTLTYQVNGANVVWNSAAQGSFAAHTLWNFPTATSVTIGTQGQYDGQFLGSVLVGNPTSQTTTYESTNGRIYTAGNFLTEGNGIEIHNYPFVGNTYFECKTGATPPTPLQGTFSITKVVTGTAKNRVPAVTEFTVDYTVNGVPAVTPLTISAAGNVVDGPLLATGDKVTFLEANPAKIKGMSWGASAISIDGATGSTLTIATGGKAKVTVTNTATADLVTPTPTPDPTTDPTVPGPAPTPGDGGNGNNGTGGGTGGAGGTSSGADVLPVTGSGNSTNTADALAITGSTVAPLLGLATLLLVAGAVLVVVRRRRGARTGA